MSRPIRFYKEGDPYGFLSNFYASPLIYEGRAYPTAEHAFQAAKFADDLTRERVARARGPMAAKRMGRKARLPRDWSDRRVHVMMAVLEAKFAAHTELAQALLETGDAYLIEGSPRDAYWGEGKDGSGENMLGRCLVQVRTQLRR